MTAGFSGSTGGATSQTSTTPSSGVVPRIEPSSLPYCACRSTTSSTSCCDAVAGNSASERSTSSACSRLFATENVRQTGPLVALELPRLNTATAALKPGPKLAAGSNGPARCSSVVVPACTLETCLRTQVLPCVTTMRSLSWKPCTPSTL